MVPREEIEAAVKGITGPVAISIVEGGKAKFDLTFFDLQALGVARVSLQGTLVRAALFAMQEALSRIKRDGSVQGLSDMVLPFALGIPAIMGTKEVGKLERRYSGGEG